MSGSPARVSPARRFPGTRPLLEASPCSPHAFRCHAKLCVTGGGAGSPSGQPSLCGPDSREEGEGEDGRFAHNGKWKLKVGPVQKQGRALPEGAGAGVSGSHRAGFLCDPAVTSWQVT